MVTLVFLRIGISVMKVADIDISYPRANPARGKMLKDFKEYASRQQGQGMLCGGEQVCPDLPSCLRCIIQLL